MTGTTQKPSPSLGRSASRGAAVTIGGQAIRIAVQLGSIVVLARLLAPADYGLLAMVTAIIGIGEIFRDFGLSSAAIQAKEITPGQKSNLFWMNAGIGLTLTLLVIAASWPIAALYGDDRLQLLTVVLSSTFLLNGISTQFRADLARHLRFVKLTLVDIVGQVLGLVVGVLMALGGAGYWALAASQVVQPLIGVLMLVFITGWRPGRYRRGEAMGHFLRYGGGVFATQALTYASKNVDSVIIGARFGPVDLGLYNRAFQLMMLPLQQLNAPAQRVALPVLSKLQDERERFRTFILFGQSAMLTVMGLVLAVLGSQSDSVIRILLGERWLASVPIFQILLVAGFFQATAYCSWWVFLSKGLVRQSVWYSLATRPLMVVLILLGSNWGVTGVAVAYAGSLALTWPIALIWIGRTSDAPAREMFTNGLRSGIAFGSITVGSFFSTVWIAADQPVLRLLVGGAAVLVGVGLWMLILPAFRRQILGLADLRRHFRRSRPAAAPAPATVDATSPTGDSALVDGAVTAGTPDSERPPAAVPPTERDR
ncbi:MULTISPECIES: lipopolysaccharide biosynthesis protein [unclassified Rathayibacter]|uniref:lipopolysaccharide biosynthesis protein n=1 Tax=unclassified Rathayibacter TaxID=2609250 RepID=UPI000CE8E3B0|nr:MULTISPECIES: lipopolysaccharide biosynthesis protein [unclassified Rathayibacter]PPF28345.1 lipopolysaccharide biosynthesis protein [Rathayibacter sp. AY1A3]PPF34199.1 lipopolysaccharide biosynthesis protein [Rathayibacter sp. AY1A2]PPF56763.1 lipopolysaccharide biosynthesis protein [Rathayibacter sp. AY1C2]PPG32508.1 lipopolysaccharide biosynthesis protein [Rathayibacter sp. AY2B9]PPH57067.1 lipopolysaccharide biosynthesis protein [Rathayibacter sp. AY1E1]